MKNKAFTLAETLIVIGIIGVVAALTLPNLNHATGDKETVTRVKKIYSALTDAFDRATAVYGNADTWFNDIDNNIPACNERFAKRVTEFLKVSKDCGINSGCFSSAPLLPPSYFEYELDENYVDSLVEVGAYMVLLSDGTSLAFRTNDYPDGEDIGHPCKINVDIDGPNKGKNQLGKDIFDFSIYFNDSGSDIENTVIPSTGWKTGNFYLDSCSYLTIWVVENENLDYLKCPDELNWETQTSCK